jgi:lysophospholipase L1-like esterase
VLLEGINDIGVSGPGGMFGDTPLADPQAIIAADLQIIGRAHEHGIAIIGATLLPFEGAMYYTPDKEKVRLAVNEWIRSSGKFDAIVDFDAALRDPASPGKFLASFDSGDHLHPGAAGARKMADAIDLKLFK